MVPACPDWSVKDLIAHLQHVSVEYAVGRHEYSTQDVVEFAAAWRRDRPAVDRWAQLGVDVRRECSLDGLLDVWAGTSPALYRMMVGEQVLAEGLAERARATACGAGARRWADPSTHRPGRGGDLLCRRLRDAMSSASWHIDPTRPDLAVLKGNEARYRTVS
jgi:hypothetical protein